MLEIIKKLWENDIILHPYLKRDIEWLGRGGRMKFRFKIVEDLYLVIYKSRDVTCGVGINNYTARITNWIGNGRSIIANGIYSEEEIKTIIYIVNHLKMYPKDYNNPAYKYVLKSFT